MQPTTLGVFYESGPAQQGGPDAQLSELYSTPSRQNQNLPTTEQEAALSAVYSVPSRRGKSGGAAGLDDGSADVCGSSIYSNPLGNDDFSGFGVNADANATSDNYMSAKAAPLDATYSTAQSGGDRYGFVKLSRSDEDGGGGTGGVVPMPVYAVGPHFEEGDAYYVNCAHDAQYATVAEQASLNGGPAVVYAAAAATDGMVSSHFPPLSRHPLLVLALPLPSRVCSRLLYRAERLVAISFVGV